MSQSHSSATLVSTGARSAAAGDVDAALVQRVQSGDMAAFDVLVNKYRERLYALVYHMTSNREDASDLTQEAFIKAFASIQQFKGRSSFYTWLYRIAVNHTLTSLKRLRWRRFFSLEEIRENSATSEILERLQVPSTADKSLYIKELQEKLNEAMQKLSHKHRTVVILFEMEGLSHQEIAQIMDCTEGTVRSRLHYAKLELQSHLQEYLH